MKQLTKILATLGPSSEDIGVLRQLVEHGVRAVRLNFSHGSYESKAELIRTVRQVEAESGRPIAILADLSGPKIRLGEMQDEVRVKAGERLRVQKEPVVGDVERVSCSLPHLLDDVAVGDNLLIDDGRVQLVAEELAKDAVLCRVRIGGHVRSRKGLNLPDTDLSLSALTKKDREDAEWIAGQDVDYVALSFVQRPSDIDELRDLLASFGCVVPIMAKIEKPLAVQRIDEILNVCEAVMVARGDLAVEMDFPQVPVAQKRITRKALAAGKPCVIATEMMESMVTSATPTRAEVSDVANAVYDGADAVMLSAETAAGEWPEEAVTIMHRIARQVESDEAYLPRVRFLDTPPDRTTADALAHACMTVADTVAISAITVFTGSGSTARRVARERPSVPMMVLTPSMKTARRLALLWGAHAVATKDIGSFEEMIAKGKRMALRHRFAAAGSKLIALAGVPFGTPGSTNLMHVVSIAGDELEKHEG